MAEESEPTTTPKTLYDELQAMFPGGKFPPSEGAIPSNELWVSNQSGDDSLGEDEGFDLETAAPKPLDQELRTVNPRGKLPQDQALDENYGLDQDQSNGYEGDVENCGHCREFSRTYAEHGADHQ